MIAAKVSAQSRLRDFYRHHYVPHCLEDPTSRNVEGYRRALDLWEALTPDPRLDQIDADTLSDFKAALIRFEYNGRTLHANTVRKHLAHVQFILDQAGPTGPRQLRSAAGLLATVPYTKPPRRRRTHREPVAAADLVAFWRATEAAELPRVPGVTPAAMWQALIATAASTSLRIGQLNNCPTDALDLAAGRLVLPAHVCTKSKSEETKPLHPFAVARLLAIRTDREMLFPLWNDRGPTGTPRAQKRGRNDRMAPHAKTTIYKELHRLQRIAGVPRFGFHDIRRRTLTTLAAISPAAAQLAAGHASYQTTMLYQGLEILGDAVRQMPLFDDLGEADASRA